MEVAQLCATLLDPMDYSLPSSSIHGIFQASVLEWLAISFSRGSSQPGDWTQVSLIAGRWQPCMRDSKRDTDMIWENSIETCTLPSVKQITSLSSMHETGHLKLVHWENPRDGMGREVGGRSGMRGHMYTRGWFMSTYGKKSQYCKTISLQLK